MNYALAAILAWAVLAKAPGMPSSMLRAMAGLALPARFMDPVVAWAHLVAQVGAIALLILTPQLGYIAALALFVVYLVLVVRARGGQCHCFSGPPIRIGPALIMRNLALVISAVAGLVGLPWLCVVAILTAVIAQLRARSASAA